MNSSKYRVIVFDLGNVLIPFDYNIIIDSINKIEPGLGDKFKKLYYENYNFHQELEKNNLTPGEFTSKMLTWLDNKIDAEKFYHIYSNIFTVNEKMISLLPRLKENYKLVLLSNTNFIHQKYGWEKYGFLKHFEKLILSHEVGAAKPEIEIYRAVEKFTNEPSNTHFFTDDIPEYVDAAKSIGWDGVVFTTYENFISSLHEKSII